MVEVSILLMGTVMGRMKMWPEGGGIGGIGGMLVLVLALRPYRPYEAQLMDMDLEWLGVRDTDIDIVSSSAYSNHPCL